MKVEVLLLWSILDKEALYNLTVSVATTDTVMTGEEGLHTS